MKEDSLKILLQILVICNVSTYKTVYDDLKLYLHCLKTIRKFNIFDKDNIILFWENTKINQCRKIRQ
jgi:hypothetical protein